MTVKIENKPKENDIISIFDLVFKLKAIKIGKIGNMHGDNIEITPIKKEINGNISIYIPLSSLKNSFASTKPSILPICF